VVEKARGNARTHPRGHAWEDSDQWRAIDQIKCGDHPAPMRADGRAAGKRAAAGAPPARGARQYTCSPWQPVCSTKFGRAGSTCGVGGRKECRRRSIDHQARRRPRAQLAVVVVRVLLGLQRIDGGLQLFLGHADLVGLEFLENSVGLLLNFASLDPRDDATNVVILAGFERVQRC
jgi:hypothetical protein